MKLKTIFAGLAMMIVLISGTYGFYAHAEDIDANFAKAKAAVFQDAMSEFGAGSAREAAMIWAKGVQNRNGALQYAVMDKKLKKIYNESMERERPSWISGVSSPWVKNFTIVDKQRAGLHACFVTVQFKLADSTGSAGSGEAKLLIGRAGRFWTIRSIERGPNLIGF